MVKTFFYRAFQLSTNKFFEAQFFFAEMYFSGIDFSFELFTYKSIFRFFIDLYIFEFDLRWSRRHDHAGIGLNICILNVNFDFNLYDTRHWNDEFQKFY